MSQDSKNLRVMWSSASKKRERPAEVSSLDSKPSDIFYLLKPGQTAPPGVMWSPARIKPASTPIPPVFYSLELLFGGEDDDHAVVATPKGKTARKTSPSARDAAETVVEDKLESLKREALLTDIVIPEGATVQDEKKKVPSPVPGLLFAASQQNRPAALHSSSTPEKGGVNLTSWWLTGGPPRFSPPSQLSSPSSSWLDVPEDPSPILSSSTGNDRISKRLRLNESRVLLQVRAEALKAKHFEEKLAEWSKDKTM